MVDGKEYALEVFNKLNSIPTTNNPSEDEYHVVIKGLTQSVILRQFVVFKQCSVGSKQPIKKINK